MTWFDRLQSKRTHTHRLDPDQLATIVAAIDNRGGGTFNQIILLKIARRLKEMALNFDKVNEGIAKVQEDVGNVARLVEELRAQITDPDAQAKLDAIGTALETIDIGLDAIAPDAVEPEPTPEP